MKIISSKIDAKETAAQSAIIHTHTEDGREQVRIPSDAISHILGRYCCERFPGLGNSGMVDIDLTTDGNDDPLVVVTESQVDGDDIRKLFARKRKR